MPSHQANAEAMQKTLDMWQRTVTRLENELGQATAGQDHERIQRELANARERLKDVEEQLRALQSRLTNIGNAQEVHIVPPVTGEPHELTEREIRELQADRERLQGMINRLSLSVIRMQEALNTAPNDEERERLHNRILRDSTLVQQYRIRIAAIMMQLEQHHNKT